MGVKLNYLALKLLELLFLRADWLGVRNLGADGFNFGLSRVVI